MVDVPRISGNSWRGVWRDVGASVLVRQLFPDGAPHLTPSAFYFLFSGGSLTKKTDQVATASAVTLLQGTTQRLDVGAIRALGELLPSVALFGGAIGQTILPGKLQVGDLVPLCQETRHVVREALRDRCQTSVWDLRDIQQFSRKDDARGAPGLEFLPAHEQRQLEQPRTRSVTKRQPGLLGDDQEAAWDALGEAPPVQTEEIAARAGTAIQMRYGFETLAAGTEFDHWIALRDATALELSALMLTIREWSRLPTIGGRSAQGWGRVLTTYDQWVSIDPLAMIAPDALVTAEDGLLAPERYLAHLNGNRDEIVATLNAL